MIWILTYGTALEQQTYQFEPADYVYLYAFSWIVLDVLGYFVNTVCVCGGGAWGAGVVVGPQNPKQSNGFQVLLPIPHAWSCSSE